MIIIRELKHNKFEQVNVPSGRDLFARVGPRQSSGKDYSGDEYIDPSLTKVQAAQSVVTDPELKPAE